MITYEVSVSPLTKLTELHSSQNLFGFISYQILDRYGQGRLETILNNINDQKNHLAISSIMPEKSVFWPSFEIRYSSQDKFNSVIAKRIKKLKFISEKVLKDLVNQKFIGDIIVENLNNKIYSIDKDLLMYTNEIKYEYEVGIDIRFSSKEKTIYNLKSYSVDTQSNFRFLIQTDLQEVVEIFNSLNYFGLGNGKNTSLNMYQINEVKEIELAFAKVNILMSKYIPKNLDYELNKEYSLCRIDMVKTKPENRMFDTYDVKVEDAFSVIQEGSVIYTDKPRIGCLKLRENASRNLGKSIYYNGLAFLYPIEVKDNE